MKSTDLLFALSLALAASAARRPHNSCSETFVISAAPGIASPPPPPNVLRKDNETQSLSACVSACAQLEICKSFHFADTACHLFSTPLVDLPESGGEESGGGIAGEKFCLRGCAQPWAAEVFRNSELPISNAMLLPAASRQECVQLCISNTHFVCRAANFYRERRECALSAMDRFAVSEEIQLRSDSGEVDYIESNCAHPTRGLCHFSEVPGRPLASADSVYEQVPDLNTCRELCLNATEFHCRSYDFNSGICRLSHSTRFLPELRNAGASVPPADSISSYHLTSCYNVSVHCGTDSITAKIKSNKLFRGKVYDKSRPNSCVADVSSDMDFQLEMGFNDLGCEVSQESSGKFSSNIIIQHHDMIVTEQDVGLSIKCSYSLANRSVQHGVNLDVRGEPATMGTHESSFVLSPTVTMHITDRNGDDISTAQVGDPLSLRFTIADQATPYEIFVRELIAFDGVDSSEILLIDSNGCPTDPTIMGAINSHRGEQQQTLDAPFDAFKFPTSDIVQFKALVTPCLPACEPVVCTLEDYFGTSKDVSSFGRRKRREISSIPTSGMAKSKSLEEEVVVQRIRITDKFQFSAKKADDGVSSRQRYPFVLSSLGNGCTSGGSLVFLFSLVFSAQFIFFLICYTVNQRWRRQTLEHGKF